MSRLAAVVAWSALAVAIWGAFARPARRQEVPGPPLRVISYNVQLLPLAFLNKYRDAPYRAQRQAEVCRRFDVVGLCEVFQLHLRQSLLDDFRAGWPGGCWSVVPPPRAKSAAGVDSGLILLSRLPINSSHTIVYRRGVVDEHEGLLSDRLAAKGVTHARVRVARPGRCDAEIDVFLTHLESRVHARRSEQYAQLADFIREHGSAARPVLLLGDLNTAGSAAKVADAHSEYGQLLAHLRAVRPDWLDTGWSPNREPQGTSDPSAASGGQRIDYILLSNGASGPRLHLTAASVERFADDEVGFLSDRAAVTAVFEW